MIIALSPTDLPEPVVPATNKWGIFDKSITTGNPPISFPRHMLNMEVFSSKVFDATTSLSLTISRSSFGISRPITDFPGMTSTIRTLIADNALARSLARFEILLTLTPGARSSSNRVITGPGWTSTT